MRKQLRVPRAEWVRLVRDACQIHERLRERIRAGKALKPLAIRDDGQGVAQEPESVRTE